MRFFPILFLAACASPPTVYRAAHVFDGTGRPAYSPGYVAVQGDTIVGVGPLHEAPDGEVVDRMDATILPGLIDTHVHIGASGGVNMSPAEAETAMRLRNLIAYLHWGVTSVRSLSDDVDWILKAREKERDDRRFPAPRIFAAGPAFTAPGGHPVQLFRHDPHLRSAAVAEVTEPDDARARVRALADRGINVVKAVFDGRALTPSCLAAIIDEAGRLGIPAVVHTGSVGDALSAVSMGASGIEHVPWDIDRAGAEQLGRAGATYVPTLAVYDGFARLGDRDHFESLNRSRDRYGIPRAVLFGLLRAPPDRTAADMKRVREAGMATLRSFIDAGGTVVVGSDAGNPGTLHGLGTVREIELLVEAGLTPQEAILAATRDAAAHIGAGKEIGTLEPGKQADFIVVRGDPLRRISDLRNVWLTIKRGIVYPRVEWTFKCEYALDDVLELTYGQRRIDRFEDLDRMTRFGTSWDILSDASFGGASEGRLEPVADPTAVSKGCLKFTGEVSSRLDPIRAFVGARLLLDDLGFRVIDASAFRGIRFRAAGTARRHRLVVGCASVVDRDEFGINFEVSPEWRTYAFDFEKLKQMGFGRAVAFDPKELTSLLFRSLGPPAAQFELYLDDVEFYP